MQPQEQMQTTSIQVAFSKDGAQTVIGPQGWRAPDIIDQLVDQYRLSFDQCINKQYIGLDHLQSAFKQACSEKDKLIQQGESLLKAEQGQNSVLRNQNRALLLRLNELREAKRDDSEEFAISHKEQIEQLQAEKQRLIARVANLEAMAQ